jgi:hypothetical protein
VAFQTEKGIVLPHPRAVVHDSHEPLAAAFHFHPDLPGAGIEGIFQEFLHHRRRTFDDLSGGDLVAKVFRKDLDALFHGLPSERCGSWGKRTGRRP